MLIVMVFYVNNLLDVKAKRTTILPELLPNKKPRLSWKSSPSLRIPLCMSPFPPLLQISFLGCRLIPQTKACLMLQKHAPLFHSSPKLSLQNLGDFSHPVTTHNSSVPLGAQIFEFLHLSLCTEVLSASINS